jgi:TrmH family RNA methyltransferase
MRPQITSTANPAVKALRRLQRRRERDRTGLFPVEGAREIGRALDGGVAVDRLYVRSGEGVPTDLVARAEAAGIEVVPLGAEAFAAAAYRDVPGGAIAVARRFATGLPDLAGADAPLVLVVEGVEKPGNLGAVLRTAAAAGAAAVVACDPATDPFNPNVVRASLGALFALPVALAPAAETRAWLDRHGIPWWASSMHGTRPLWEADLSGAAALVVGGEESGLDPSWLADPERVIVVPTPGPVASLNLAAVAAVLLFEAVRRRSYPAG